MAKKKPTASGNRSSAAKRDEIAELEHVYANMTRTSKGRQTSSAPSVLTVLALLAAVGFMLFCFLGDGMGSFSMEMGNVTIAGVDLTGMTRSEATQALRAACDDTYTKQDMVIVVNESRLMLSPDQTGVSLNIDDAIDAAFAQGQIDTLDYLNLNTDIIDELLVQLNIQFNSIAASTTSVFDPENQVIVITMGMPQYGLDIPALREAILDAYRNNTFLVEQPCTLVEPESPDLDALYQQYYIEPIDAVMDMEVFEVSPDSSGRCFDMEAAQMAVNAMEYGQSIYIPLEEIPAEVTQESLRSILYRDVLGSCSTKHTQNEDRNENLRLACAAINGKVLMPGEQFGYNDTLGERTEKKGYKPAGSYVNGETVDTIGGGICQVSTTLYYCTLLGDLQIDRRIPHGYASDYIDLGMDATVSWGGPDFKFTNNTSYPIRIVAFMEDGYVHVTVYGTDERDTYVKMEYEVLEKIPYETVYKDYPPDNEKGYTDGTVITTPYTGYVVKTYKCRYDKQTDELLSRDFEANSTYSSRDKVICRIVDPEATEPSESTETTETDQPVG